MNLAYYFYGGLGNTKQAESRANTQGYIISVEPAQLGTGSYTKNDPRRVKRCCELDWKLRSFEHNQRIG
jgi:hypothetical protein